MSDNSITLQPSIFNTNKTDEDYAQTELFLGQRPGLFDTVHKNFPKIWDHYKNLRSLDWDANEFDYSTCKNEFLTADPLVCKRMIKTIAWQWEADSVAAHSLLTIMAPFISSPELFAVYARITENEILHATTYSEIVRLSFDNPQQVLKEVLGEQQALRRLNVVADIMGEVHDKAHLYAVNHRLPEHLKVTEDDAFESAFLYVVTMLALERIQFMASFAVTFAITVGQFLPIGQGVGKIFQDEMEVHVAVGKEVIRSLLATERGHQAYVKLLPRIQLVLNEIMESEFAWTDWMEFEEHPLPGLNARNLKSFLVYSEADVCAELPGLTPPDRGIPIPTKNPLGYMDKMLNTGKIQNANMEVQNGQYKVNLLRRNDADRVFNIDF